MPLPYTLEQDLLERKTRALQAFQDGQTVDPLTYTHLLQINRVWPDLGPGAALSLARSGFDAGHPIVRAAAKLAVQQTLNQKDWSRALNGVHTISDLHDIPKDVLDSLTPEQTRQYHQKIQHVLDSSISGGGIGDVVTGAVSDEFNKIVSNVEHGGNTATGEAAPGVAPSDVKGAVRTAALALQTPVQYAQSQERNVAAGVNDIAQGKFSLSEQLNPVSAHNEQIRASDYAQTQAGQAQLADERGQPVDIGAGWLPDPNSATGQAAAAAARAAAPTIGGHAFTFGRFTAQSAGYGTQALFGTNVVQPGSNAFNVISGGVDAALMLKGDPSARILSGLGDARDAGQVFTPEQVSASNAVTDHAGLMPLGTPPDVIQGTKSAWLDSNQGTTLANRIIDEGGGSPSKIIRLLNHQVPTDLATDLAHAGTDPTAIKQVIADATLPNKFQVGGFNYQVQKTLDARLFSTMPTHSLIDLADKDQSWLQLDRTMIAAKVPQATRDAALDTYLASTNHAQSMDAVSSTLKASLVAHGMDDTIASKAARIWRDGEDFSRSYDIDQATGLERTRPGVVIGGDGIAFPAPTADSERLSSMVRLPNARTLRQLTSSWGPVLNNPVVRGSEAFLDGIVNTWKTLVVARPELLTKITLEQQLNAAARGEISWFTHPFQTMSLVAGGQMDTRFGQLLNRLPGIEPTYMTGPNGSLIVEDGQNLLQRSLRYGGQDSDSLVTFGYHNAPLTHPGAPDGFVESLGRLHTDPIFRNIAGMTPDEAKDWFWDGEGKQIRLDRADIVAHDDAHNIAGVAAGKYGPDAQPNLIGDIANDRAAADRYLDLAHFPRLNDLTGNSPELVDAVKTGRLNGHSLYQLPVSSDGAVTNPNAVDYAKQLLADGIGPRSRIAVRDTFEMPTKTAGFFNRAMDTVFHYMIDAPDAALNRSPAYRQAVWARTAELLPYAKPDEVPGIIAQAEKNVSDTDLLNKIRNTTLDQSDTPRLSADQIHDTAKATALGIDLPKTAHDLTSRTHLFDALRFLIPFGDAWRLILKRAAQLVMDEPQTIQRLNAGLYEAKQSGSSAINRLAGDPVDGNNGFFHTDPTTGDQVWTIPGSTLLTRNTFGVPIPLQGQVKGLSMLSDVYPSLGGPGLTLPAKWLLPDTPTGNAIKDVIFPQSSSESEGPATDIGQQIVPSWFQKLARAYPNTHTFNSAFNAAAQSLASTGDYDLNKPSELSRLIHDAKHNASWIYAVRGAAQFLLPGAPTAVALVKDKSGHWANAQAAINAYQKKSAEQGPDKAMHWLIATLGVNNVLLSQSASQPVAYAAPVTTKSQQWVDANPSVASKYPLVYGLFAPAHKGDQFDLKAYEEQFTKGERQSLTPETQLAQAENRLGFYAYDRAKAQVVTQNGGRAPDKPQRDWLANYRTQLQQAFPGFDTFAAAPYDTTKRRNSAISQLQTAASDKAILATDAGQGLAAYLKSRDEAIAQAVAGGGKTPFQAKAGQALRLWLRTQAARIIQTHPDFKPMWDDVFSREMVDN